MPIHIDPDEKIDWSFPQDRDLPLGDRPVMHLRVPPIKTRSSIERTLLNNNDGEKWLTLTVEVVEAILDGWTWPLADGGSVPFQKDARGNPTKETLGRLTIHDRTKLFERGLEIMGMSVAPESEDSEGVRIEDQD